MLCLSVLGGLAVGCGGQAQRPAPVLLRPEDFQAWRRVCEILTARKTVGFKVEIPSFTALADQLSNDSEHAAVACEAAGISLQRFIEVCRAIGVAYSVIQAERVDMATTRLSHAAIAGERPCDDQHDSSVTPPPEIALQPPQLTPLSAHPNLDRTLAANVSFLRPLVSEVERVAKKLFELPSGG